MTDRPTRFSIAAKDPAFSGNNGEHRTPVDSWLALNKRLDRIADEQAAQAACSYELGQEVRALRKDLVGDSEEDRGGAFGKLRRIVVMSHHPWHAWTRSVGTGIGGGAAVVIAAIMLWKLMAG